ncbi:hypothetical protein KVR01_001495 [Diaporthe batatas]|uniref:uncharacterized protein n=1 Tax=Diaporthe batatas TaxID=748121 RepID=UPI001D043547|nr:uncharacterized protein KVR01_001495 [Diaporthe batatas]KAG8168746.1 hypothetical protein KVR01_001495 [Diaporthe batatas]
MNNKTKQYDTVWSADDPDQEEFLSETDVEEGHEKEWQSDERPARRRAGAPMPVWSTLRTYKGLVDTALLLVAIAMLGLLLLRRPQQLERRQIGGDYMGAGPEFPARIVKWNADESFVPPNASEWFSEALLGRWNTMMPAGAALRSADEVFHTTTMTHSLHCLFMMGRIFSSLAGNISGVLPDDYFTHYMHYLAIEPHLPTDGPDNGPLDGGWNGMHEQIVDGVRVVLPIDD